MKQTAPQLDTTQKRGFTLVELLLVIAIIGILAAVIIPRFENARLSGADASVKQGLGNIRAQSDVFYNSSGFTYENFCTSSKATPVLNGVAEANGGITPLCNDESNAWAAASPLVTATTTYWCVDSTGFVGESTTTLGTNTECSG